METIPIGQAARILGMNASALRYYEERGLVPPAARTGGRRVYDRQVLRRLAFLRTFQQLGVPLETAVAVLDAPAEEWRAAAEERIAELEETIARARTAQGALRHAMECPNDHPTRDCKFLVGVLDRLLDGWTFQEVVKEDEQRFRHLTE